MEEMRYCMNILLIDAKPVMVGGEGNVSHITLKFRPSEMPEYICILAMDCERIGYRL